MANIFDYIAWRGDLRFDFRPFNELDGLVLCRMSYLPCDNILGEAPMSLPERPTSGGRSPRSTAGTARERSPRRFFSPTAETFPATGWRARIPRCSR